MKKERPFDHSNEYVVSSLGEYIEVVSKLSNSNDGSHRSLWYRGHEKHSFTLLPSLIRGSKGSDQGYGQTQMREEFRYQNFRARCNQLVDSRPDTRIEWHEIMQHHFSKTRLMDWSESAITALMFAVEAFIHPLSLGRKDLQYRRSTVTPTIWVLDPVELNHKVAGSFRDNSKLLEKALEDIIDIGLRKPARQRIINDIADFMRADWSDYLTKDKDGLDLSMPGIVCLSALETERSANDSRLLNLMVHGQYNPYFYLYLRYYNDGLPVKLGSLPPLAINHPYHSKRIQAQRGVFTIFPNYMDPETDEKYLPMSASLDLRSMELQMDIAKCLNKIRVIHPTGIARELLDLGERYSSLYPEMERLAIEIENYKYPC